MHERTGRARETGHEVEGQEPPRADPLLEQRPEPPQRHHVQQQMERPVMQERRSDQPPVLVVGDADLREAARYADVRGDPDDGIPRLDAVRDQHALLEDRPFRRVDAGPLRELGHVDEDVERDQSAGDPRAGTLEGGSLRPLGHSLHALRATGVLRAADPDGRHRHAFGADRTSALGAGQPCDAVGMAVAGSLGGLGHGLE